MKRTALSIAIGCLVATAPAAGLAAEYPRLEPDDSWISLSGTVTSSTANSFMLDYGNGLITVEMDDWDWFAEEGAVLPGDSVTVYGEVDDELFDKTTIDADSVYVEDLGTYFYASPGDDEAPTDVDLTPTATADAGDMVLTGTVTSIEGREFTINSGALEITVDTIFMPYDPTDDEGYQQISEGDRVTVSGEVEAGTFDDRELVADTVITLYDDSES